MKSSFLYSLVLFMTFSLFSCKEKAVVETSANGNTTLPPAAPATGQEYFTDATMAKITWIGSKPDGKHFGTINVSDGTLYVNDGRLTAGNVTIDMNSILVADLEGEDKVSLEAHLKGTESEGAEDFFNVTKYPTGKFEVVEIMGASDQPNSNATVTGNLTLLNKTKTISFPALISIGPDNISVNTIPFNINRTDYGITYKSKNIFKDLGDKFLDDDIVLQFSLSAMTMPSAGKK
ncbi:MAG: YceI family protein [Saprospiraceae bacterium]|nr:YceI family protein [Saprospiraceae bacterium]